MGSIRFRLTVLYSSVLFGLAAVLVGTIYVAESRSLGEEQVYKQFPVVVFDPQTGQRIFAQATFANPYQAIEHQANERALEVLRVYSAGALLGLFLASLVVGWVVAGRVLEL